MGFLGGLVDTVSSWFTPAEEDHQLAPAPAEDVPHSGVELCRTPAFGMGNTIYRGLKAVGIDASHQWVRGPGFESGMARDPDSWNPLKVAFKDHQARGEKEAARGQLDCKPIEQENPLWADVNAEDVARHARPGKKIPEMYKLVTDNCQSAAQGAVKQAAFEKANRSNPLPLTQKPEDLMSLEPHAQAMQSLFHGYSS